jgi:glycosyltransferase involved in cell wall biosynthesis
VKVGLLSQWLAADGENFVGALAQTLAEQGADVTCVVGTSIDEGSPKPWRLDKHKQQFARYRALRYPYFRSQDRSSLKRAVTYATFSAVTGVAAIGALRANDVVLVYSSPATAAWAAMVCRRLSGTPYVLLVQDVWPDSVFASGFITQGRVRRVAEWNLNRFVDASYRNAAAVVAISPNMRELLVSRGVPDHKAHAIYNWADESVVGKPLVFPVRATNEPLHLMYAGNLGFAQNLDNVFHALAQAPAGSVRLTLIGGGAAEQHLRRTAELVAPGLVTFRPRVPVEELPPIMEEAHLHLISLADEEVFQITLPSKLQFLLAAGAPILSVAPGEVSEIVTRERVGLAARPADVADLTQALKLACALTAEELSAMAARARHVYDLKMSKSINASKLTSILRKASAESGSSRARRHQ